MVVGVKSCPAAASSNPVSVSSTTAGSKPLITGFSTRTSLPAASQPRIMFSETYVLPRPVPQEVTNNAAISAVGNLHAGRLILSAPERRKGVDALAPARMRKAGA